MAQEETANGHITDIRDSLTLLQNDIKTGNRAKEIERLNRIIEALH